MAYPVIDAPYGFKAINELNGLPYAGATRQFPIARSYATNIFYGDLVQLQTDGTLILTSYSAASSPTSVIAGAVGVFVGCQFTNPTTKQLQFSQYYPASTAADDILAFVVDDPSALFKVVMVGQTSSESNIASTVGYANQSFIGTNVYAVTGVAGGTTSNYSKITETISDYTLAGLTRSVITGRTTAGGSSYVNVKVNPSGALTTATTIDDISPVDGQKTMALSFPVVIASDQSAVPVSMPNEGQQTMANSISVAIASNQTSVPVSIAAANVVPIQYAANTVVRGKYTITAGTATQISVSSVPIVRIDVRADINNVGNIYLGDSSLGAGKSFFLLPGEAWSFDISDLQLLWYDGDTTGDFFVVNYFEP